MGKPRAIYHVDNRTKHSGDRVEKLGKQLVKLAAKRKAGTTNEKWLADAEGKANARAKKYGLKVKLAKVAKTAAKAK